LYSRLGQFCCRRSFAHRSNLAGSEFFFGCFFARQHSWHPLRSIQVELPQQLRKGCSTAILDRDFGTGPRLLEAILVSKSFTFENTARLFCTVMRLAGLEKNHSLMRLEILPLEDGYPERFHFLAQMIGRRAFCLRSNALSLRFQGKRPILSIFLSRNYLKFFGPSNFAVVKNEDRDGTFAPDF
jgi:hypothetical protein